MVDKKKPIKVGILGLGKMGMLHLKNCRFVKHVQVVAAADRSERALRKARGFGVKHLYSDYRSLLQDAGVDAVVISLPNFLHVESGCMAAQAGTDIFIEKPLATTVAGCSKIAKAVRKHGVKLMVGHNYRFIDSVKKVKEVFERGIIGDVEIATLELILSLFAPTLELKPIPDWYFSNETMGMGCLDSGYHLIDVFQWLFDEADVLYAHLGYRYHLPYEDSAIVVLKSRKGSTKGIINVGWFSKMIFPLFDFHINLHGTLGFVSTDHFAPKNLYLHAAKEATKNVLRRMLGMRIHPLTYTYYYPSYFKELRHFFDCVRNDVEPTVTVEDGLKTIMVIERIYRKAQSYSA